MPISPKTGIVLGAIVGFIFVFTCILSVIKAVRDRKKIKRRIAERERAKAANGVKNGKCVCSIEVSQEPSSSKSNKSAKQTNGKLNQAPLRSVSEENTEISEDLKKSGVDNLTYAHSYSDIKHTSANQSSKSKRPAENEAPQNAHAPSKRSVSNDIVERRGQRQLSHLPQECLAVQKILRRHSYDMAVCENSWLPAEPPTFQTSNKIIQTYSFGRPNSKTSTTGFENRAFDTEDHKKT